MPGVSIHVVDVSRGEPALGMAVGVFELAADGSRRRIGGGTVGAGGLLDDAALGRGDGLGACTLEVELQAGEYFRRHGLADGPPAFQETVVYRFAVIDPARHVHLPIKLSPWGLSVWRGH
jgi:5-hydroxyisourate hydrolase